MDFTHRLQVAVIKEFETDENIKCLIDTINDNIDKAEENQTLYNIPKMVEGKSKNVFVSKIRTFDLNEFLKISESIPKIKFQVWVGNGGDYCLFDISNGELDKDIFHLD